MRAFLRISTFAALTILAAVACSSANPGSAQAGGSPAAAVTPPPGSPQVRIVTTEGTIVVMLDPAHAPVTVANFLKYVDAKFFNGGTFFRVIPGFVIQGGNQAKESSSDRPIALEDPKATGVYNVDGAIAMARTNDPNSATSEFFIDDGAQTALDGQPGSAGYAAFGVVTSGMDVVRKIARLPAQDEHLIAPIKILTIERVK